MTDEEMYDLTHNRMIYISLGMAAAASLLKGDHLSEEENAGMDNVVHSYLSSKAEAPLTIEEQLLIEEFEKMYDIKDPNSFTNKIIRIGDEMMERVEVAMERYQKQIAEEMS